MSRTWEPIFHDDEPGPHPPLTPEMRSAIRAWWEEAVASGRAFIGSGTVDSDLFTQMRNEQ